MKTHPHSRGMRYTCATGSVSYRNIMLASLAMGLSVTMSAKAQLLNLGNPYSPAGANYDIFGYQSMTPDATTPTGTTTGAHVNQNFEYTPGIGVAYSSTDSKGKVTTTEFGIGLYQASSGTMSTGLDVRYDKLVFANSVSIVLGDFDMKSTDKDFLTGKVSPSAIIKTGSGAFVAASPTEVMMYMKYAGISPGKGGEDQWTFDVGGLLAHKGLSASTLISDVYLSASKKNGAGQTMTTKSDPYFINSVSNGVAVPEPGSMALFGASAALMLGVRRRRRN